MSMKKVLTIAGSDSSGGAGIQADLKTMTAFGVYGMSVITALTAQNTTGVQGVYPVTPEFVAQQIESVFTDIEPDAVKIGMLFTADVIRVTAKKLASFGARNIIVDPVMVATSGAKLIQYDAIEAMCDELFPLATLITPNIPEAEVLSGVKISSVRDMEVAARVLHEKYKCAVLCKGGHSTQDANDLLCARDENLTWFEGQRVETSNTHGTGCTLSSAIACGVACGFSLEDAIRAAKKYLEGALGSGLDLGKGSGPMNHMWNLANIVSIASVAQEKL